MAAKKNNSQVEKVNLSLEILLSYVNFISYVVQTRTGLLEVRAVERVLGSGVKMKNHPHSHGSLGSSRPRDIFHCYSLLAPELAGLPATRAISQLDLIGILK